MKKWAGQRVLRVAMEQSALDAGCSWEDFLRTENVIVPSQTNPGARKYLELPFSCHLISYGNNVVASVSGRCQEFVTDYLSRFAPEHCFETPNLHVLNDALEREGLRVCFMAEYFLPDFNALNALECSLPYEADGAEGFRSTVLPGVEATPCVRSVRIWTCWA